MVAEWTDYVYDPYDPCMVYEPKEVILTTMDGRQYKMHIEKGLESMRDLNGNELVINENGVISYIRSIHQFPSRCCWKNLFHNRSDE